MTNPAYPTCIVCGRMARDGSKWCSTACFLAEDGEPWYADEQSARDDATGILAW